MLSQWANGREGKGCLWKSTYARLVAPVLSRATRGASLRRHGDSMLLLGAVRLWYIPRLMEVDVVLG